MYVGKLKILLILTLRAQTLPTFLCNISHDIFTVSKKN